MSEVLQPSHVPFIIFDPTAKTTLKPLTSDEVTDKNKLWLRYHATIPDNKHFRDL